MCGIVGLFLRNEALEPRLGELAAGMLATMSDRGPDSAGFAVYGRPSEGVKLTLRGPNARQLAAAVSGLERELGSANMRAASKSLAPAGAWRFTRRSAFRRTWLRGLISPT
jgi:glutamate synthase domain-containing protein 1